MTRLAERRGTGLGELIRSACETQYGLGGSEERLLAVDELSALDLPVGSPEELKAESIPTPVELEP